jgi:nicotinate-nucleotide adenylyltransferase
MREKICFGGTFNPIHHGHLLCARVVCEAIGAEKIVLFPNGNPAYKTGELARGADRLEMCRLATLGDPLFEIDDREVRRAGPTFTIDTVRELRQIGFEKVSWLIGADMLNMLPKWHRAAELLTEVRFLIMARPGTPMAWDTLPAEYQALRANVITVPQIDISSTDIRRRSAAGLPIDYLCPPAVCRYITDHQLYQTR